MKSILTNNHISIHRKRRALGYYIEPILMYGCEASTISKQVQKKKKNWRQQKSGLPRRMLRISWTANIPNKTVLQEANTTRSLINRIYKRQATFFGHVMRKEKLEHLMTTVMIEGKRNRKMLDGHKVAKVGRVTEALKAARNRNYDSN